MSKTLIETGIFIAATDRKTLDNGKNVRSFYIDITDNPEYPNTPEFGLYGDKCDIVDGFTTGQEVEVFFNLKGMKYNNKKTNKPAVFTKLEAWKVTLILSDDTEPVDNIETTTEGDDLPF